MKGAYAIRDGNFHGGVCFSMSGFLSGLAERLPSLRALDRPVVAGGVVAGRVLAGRTGRLGPALLLVLLAALCILQAVRLVWAATVPVGPLGAWQPKGAEILSQSERTSLFSAFDPFFRSANMETGQATVTALGLTLFGINLNEATGGGSAIIAGEDGVQSSYALGDEIAPGVTLAGLAFDHVILERGGARESLFMDQSGDAPMIGPDGGAAATGVTPAAAAIPQPPVAGVAANGEITADALKKGISFGPRLEGGKVTGLTVQPQGDGAIFRAAGLRDGDVIRAINGRPIGSAADVTGIAAAFRAGARLSLDVERGASQVPIALFLAKS